MTAYYKDGKTNCNHSDLRRAYPNVSFPESIPEEVFRQYGYIPVFDEQPPVATGTHRPETYDRVEGDRFIKGWKMSPKTQMELDIDQANVRVLNEKIALSVDPDVVTFIDQTPESLTGYVHSKVQDLNDVKKFLVLLSKSILVTSRREHKRFQ